MIGAVFLGFSFYYGIGLWGNNQPVGWAFPIVNFVFWVGIGHAGTLISAILFLLRQKMANRYCKICRSDDNFCSYVRWNISSHSYWSSLVSGLLNYLIQISTVFGLILLLHLYGMFLQYQHTLLFHLFSGM